MSKLAAAEGELAQTGCQGEGCGWMQGCMGPHGMRGLHVEGDLSSEMRLACPCKVEQCCAACRGAHRQLAASAQASQPLP